MNHKQSIPGFTQRLLSLIGNDPPYAWAIRMGIPKATMHGLLRQASPSTATLLRIAEGTDVSINWLLTGRERVSGGSRGRVEAVEESERWLAPEIWGEEEGADGGSMPGMWVMVDGDGMEPLLRCGDWMRVDPRENAVGGDGIYLLEVEGKRIPKRLQRGLGGEVRVGCDNPAYEDVVIPPERRSQLVIIGRVVWISRRI
ncbi:MAG: helix-turn-helix transcriptional regulator [Magnetococcales bacterium]|nr:helix-turn-helix transcriptional regulator [Magnetococcales bacterium]